MNDPDFGFYCIRLIQVIVELPVRTCAGMSSMENSGVQVDKFTKGHSRGLSAGSAASVVPTHHAKSLSDVADMVSKSPQVAALDLN